MGPVNQPVAGESRTGRPLTDGPPPPGLRRGLSKREKEDTQDRETKKKDKGHKNRLKDSVNAEPPTTTYAPEVMHYPKIAPESSVQRTHSSFRDHKHDSSAARLPVTSDSQGKVGPPSNSVPALDRRETPITPSASVSTQNQPRHAVRSSGRLTNPRNILCTTGTDNSKCTIQFGEGT
ncbi:hypothetical protein DFH94DRAFT_109557 [Russula ochroleuca]|uniref:Uncharacterized protein n=1 Tax=Russula ochroleuca TaxID=152965 RepID=A0A9P5T5M3_9AGAM|nr:hypothetical protein DFH94DRAFT_109557 [Russula ochroleuca]